MDRVLEFSVRLRADGIDCVIDQYQFSPPTGWPRWTEAQIEQADYVLVICTENYRERFRAKAAPGQGLGVRWEGAVITQDLYDAETNNTRFIPVVFTAQDVAFIPSILRGATRYDLSFDGEYEKLYRHLTNQPSVTMPALGSLRPMPARERRQNFQPPDAIREDVVVLEPAEPLEDQRVERPERPGRPTPVKTLHKHLATFIQIVVFLFAAFGGFLNGIAPPEQTSPKFAVGFTSFLVLIVLLIISSVSGRGRPGNYRRWIWVGVASLIVVVISGVLYPYLLGKYTYVYPPSPEPPVAWRVNGSKYAKQAQDFIKENPGNYTPGELELELPYDQIWTAESLARAKMILLIAYIVLVVSIATAVFCLLEANFKRRAPGEGYPSSPERLSERNSE
jgi:hypothetical protein